MIWVHACRARRAAIGLASALLLASASANAEEVLDFSRRNRCYPLQITGPSGDWNVPTPAAQRGPLPIRLAPNDGGLTRQACARSEVGIVSQIRATDDGAIQAFGRWEFAPYQALGLGIEARWVPGRVELGNTTLMYTKQFELDAFKTITALSVRALLPTSTLAGRVGGEAGLALAHIQHGLGWLEYHLYLGGDVAVPAVEIEAGAPFVEAHAIGVVGVQIHTYREPFAFVFDIHGRAGTSSAVVPAGGLRLHAGPFHLEIGAGYSISTLSSERGLQVIARISWVARYREDAELH